jgi:Atypical PilZ domain, cyclic di-GMP receptor
MPESFLGEGLIYEDLLPLDWIEGPLPQGLGLARLNADNYQLLGAESTLDEVRVSEALKEESPALLHELQRLEYKLNILLRLTAQLASRSSPLPAARATRLASLGLEWCGQGAPEVGRTGLLHVYINPALPQPLRIPCIVAGERMDDGERIAQLRFRDLSDAVVDMLEKLIFRHHRRSVAGARSTAPPTSH